MKLFKRVPKSAPTYKAAVWWADFSVNGQRFRISTDTNNKTEANTLAKKKEAQANDGKLSASSQSFARLTFTEAADKYLTSRKLELQPSSVAKEKQLLVQLKAFFGPTRLNRISAEQVLNFRECRAATCGPALVNMEVGVLRRVLKRGKLWHAIADDIKPLKEPETIGRALSPDEKAALLEAAALRPEWETAYCASILALNTTMRGCEIKGLLWSDIDLLNETLSIRRSKTEAGIRKIPLTRAAFDVLVRLRERAETFGSVEPGHYVFASFKPVGRFDNREIVEHRMLEFDPTKPLGSWKKAWAKLTTKAGLKGLRFHDLRHHCITELCESGASEQTIKAIAGHVSQRMLDRYSHIRLEAKRRALDVLGNNGNSGNSVTGNSVTHSDKPDSQQGYVTSNDTKSGHSQPLSSQTIDSIGRRVGI